MKKNLMCFVVLLFSNHVFSQNDTIWYDKDWKATVKSNASFFRPKPQKVKDRFVIKDYYLNGTLQMEGPSLKEVEEFFDGDVKHYRANGKLETITSYKNNSEVYFKKYYENGNIDWEVPFKDGKKNGDMILHNEKGEKVGVFPFRNDLERGIFVLYEDGKAAKNKFFINGKEIESRSEFNEKFYSKGVKTEGNFQVVNLDEVEERDAPPTKKIKKDEKISDLSKFMDFYESENGTLGITKMSKTFDKEYFKSTSKDVNKIIFTIHNTNDGLYIMETYKTYKPKENEIVFLYENPEKLSLSTQKVYFKLGNKIKKAIKENSIDPIEIVAFLEHKIFGVNEFSGIYAYSILEDELQK